MEISKYKLNIEREFVRTDSKNELVKNTFPKVFGDKAKNCFITANDENKKFKIRTPFCYNVEDTYEKLEEITNVVIEELYKLNQNIWPLNTYTSKTDKIKLYTKINFSLNKDLIENSTEEAYIKIKNWVESNLEFVSNAIGDFKIKLTRDGIQIFNINVDYSSKCGIKKETLLFLIVVLFGGLEEDLSSTVQEKIDFLKKVSKKYNLKTQNVIDQIKETKLIKKDFKEDEINQIIKKYMDEGHNARYF